jgi:hypothetical protein
MQAHGVVQENQEKIKYMYMTRKVRNAEDELDLQVDGMSFQQVHDFKYLGVNINNRNCMHNEIKLRLKAGNGCYFALLHLLKSKLLSKKAKKHYIPCISDQLCHTLVVPELQQQEMKIN